MSKWQSGGGAESRPVSIANNNINLVKLGVLEKVQESKWGSPTFIIQKKNNWVRFVSDFRMLNQKVKRKPYPLPRISDTLKELEGFQYATSLDLNMGYYRILLSDKSSDMWTIVTDFGSGLQPRHLSSWNILIARRHSRSQGLYWWYIGNQKRNIYNN